jgi:hypothetical protein
LIKQDYGNIETLEEDYDLMSTRPKGKEDGKLMKKLLHRIDQSKVDLVGPSKFTSEALITYLEKQPNMLIAGDEFTKMFKGTIRKDFLVDNMEDLSRLYDSDPDKVVTQARAIEYPEDAHVNFVSATTPYIFKFMDEDFFRQGTGNRILWILMDEVEVPDEEELAVEIMEDMFLSSEEYENMKSQLQGIADMLIFLRERLPEGLILPNFDSIALISKYMANCRVRTIERYNMDKLSVIPSYIKRMEENCIRLALTHCISRYAWEGYNDEHWLAPDRMEINTVDAEWAVSKMRRHESHFWNLLEMAREYRERKEEETDKARSRREAEKRSLD